MPNNHNPDGESPTYARTFHEVDVNGRVVPVLHVETRNNPAERGGDQPAPYGPNDTSEIIVGQVERKIAQLEGRINETAGFDSRTGEQRYMVDPTTRARLQKEVEHMRTFTLPRTVEMGRLADEYHAANTPTAAEKLQRELERHAAIKARALTLADDMEAEAKARAIVKARGLGIAR